MKRIYILLLVFTLINIGKGQEYVVIPDANFVAYLQENFPSCMDGNKMDIGCSQIKTTTHLSVSGKIRSLTGIQYFVNLQYLDCSNNRLATLTNLPNSLTVLKCDKNLLAALPLLPPALQYLYCNQNNLESLPPLPNTIKGVDCQNNQIAKLPYLPNSLEALFCSYNYLTALPDLPNSLTSLSCGYNSIKSLPALPESLKYLYCNSNLLNSLPILPENLLELYCTQNNIKCFPLFPNSLQKIFISDNPFGCLPNYVDAMDEATKAYPICREDDANNPFSCVQIVSLKENQMNYKLTVFPNPGNGSYTIGLDKEMRRSPISYKVEDIFGKEILSSILTFPVTEIDLTRQADGIYIIKFTGADFSLNQRLIKQ